MAEPRKYVPERDKTYPEIDVTANYEIKNLQFGPVTLTMTNPQRNQMESLTLGGRKKTIIPGLRMTDYIFELESRGMIKVVKQG